jgi:RimJ/RimL family protein N-acetyltransferase
VDVGTVFFVLRGGAVVRLRPVNASEADAAGLHALHRAVVLAGEGKVVTRADLPADAAPRLHAARVAALPARGSAWFVAAPAGGAALPSILGLVTVAREGSSLLRHVADVSIEVHPAVQGQGLGRALMEEALAWADDPARGLTRVELKVRADNERALRLYRALGFEEEGRLRRHVRQPDGTYVDVIVMARLR